MTRQEIVLEHLKDLIHKIEYDYNQNDGFYGRYSYNGYDNTYNGYDNNGGAEYRNTPDLLSSLRWLHEMLDIS